MSLFVINKGIIYNRIFKQTNEIKSYEPCKNISKTYRDDSARYIEIPSLLTEQAGEVKMLETGNSTAIRKILKET